MLLKFKYWIELKNGYKPVQQTEEEHEITIIIEARNRVTADRMIKAMFAGNDNVISIDGTCID